MGGEESRKTEQFINKKDNYFEQNEEASLLNVQYIIVVNGYIVLHIIAYTCYVHFLGSPTGTCCGCRDSCA